MQTFIAVLLDLKDFVKESLLRLEKTKTSQLLRIETRSRGKVLTLDQNNQPVTKVAQAVPANSLSPVHGEVSFVCVPIAKVFDRAVMSYDGVVDELEYGTKVAIIGYEGRFAHINSVKRHGWILKEDIHTDLITIFPQLVSGNVYDATNSETVKLRKLIEDDFFAEELFLSLQPEEVVTYFLNQKGLEIEWSNVRPRTSGTWQQLLKGQLGISIGITPKSGSVIEYWKENGEGWVGYTKSVMVDESISIVGVGRNKDGEYLEEQIPKSTWQEWRPVWISIS